jgi:hypothetical protein
LFGAAVEMIFLPSPYNIMKRILGRKETEGIQVFSDIYKATRA